jgi:small subunit ribosomal protein S11
MIKVQKELKKGIIYIKVTFRNIFLTLCNFRSKVYCWHCSGVSRFRCSEKSTPLAWQAVSNAFLKKIHDCGLKKAHLVFLGVEKGKEHCLSIFLNDTIRILSIRDKSRFPYNGCRPPKPRSL